MSTLVKYTSEHIIVSVSNLVKREYGEDYIAHRDGVIFKLHSDKYPERVGSWFLRNQDIVLLVTA